MANIEVRTYDVTDNNVLPSLTAVNCPQKGDPVEIDHEMYFVCERDCNEKGDLVSVGLIPLVVRNPKKISNIQDYLNCLSIAHRRVQFRKDNKTCDFEECDEMVIS